MSNSLKSNCELTPLSPDYGKNARRNQCVWLIFLFLTALLYLLPHYDTEAMRVHASIVGALKAGNNWGRQALVGNVDYPLLQSLSLLASDFVSYFLFLDGERLLVAVAQGWTLAYFIRAVCGMRHWFAATVPVALVIVVPFIRNAFLTLDPNWVVAVPFAAVFYHLLLWHNNRELRDIMLVGGNSGLLCLAGIGPALAAFFSLLVVYFQLKRFYNASGKDFSGTGLLLWSAFAYCLLLWFLWNHLVLDDILFGLRDLWMRADTVSSSDLVRHLRRHAMPLGLCLFFLSPLAILTLKTKEGSSALWLFPLALSVCAMLVITSALGIPATGLAQMAVCLLLSVYAILTITEFTKPVVRTACLISIVICSVMAFRVAKLVPNQRQSKVQIIRAYDGPPAPNEITDFIDKYWPQSRTLLYGLRLPAAYPIAAEQRFIPRLDYQEGELLRKAKDEQLHLLLPPDNGKYYPKHPKHPLAQIHANGKDWLLLEKQWSNGWQLWRCVIPPKNASKLNFLK